jgi:hypothetical protein
MGGTLRGEGRRNSRQQLLSTAGRPLGGKGGGAGRRGWVLEVAGGAARVETGVDIIHIGIKRRRRSGRRSMARRTRKRRKRNTVSGGVLCGRL